MNHNFPAENHTLKIFPGADHIIPAENHIKLNPNPNPNGIRNCFLLLLFSQCV